MCGQSCKGSLNYYCVGRQNGRGAIGYIVVRCVVVGSYVCVIITSCDICAICTSCICVNCGVICAIHYLSPICAICAVNKLSC